jgi:hypothetical protein
MRNSQNRKREEEIAEDNQTDRQVGRGERDRCKGIDRWIDRQDRQTG